MVLLLHYLETHVALYNRCFGKAKAASAASVQLHADPILILSRRLAYSIEFQVGGCHIVACSPVLFIGFTQEP